MGLQRTKMDENFIRRLSRINADFSFLSVLCALA